jgi:hypothetical protein
VKTHTKDIRNILHVCNMCNNNNNYYYYIFYYLIYIYIYIYIYINHDDTTLPEICNLLLAGYYCTVNVVVLDGSFINDFL